MNNLGFERTLAVVTHGKVMSPGELSLDGVNETNHLARALGTLVPEQAKTLLVHGDLRYIRETADYLERYLEPAMKISLESLSAEENYSTMRESMILADLAGLNVSEFDVIVAVTSLSMSAWLSGILHTKGGSFMKLIESCAYVTKDDGTVYLASSTGSRKLL